VTTTNYFSFGAPLCTTFCTINIQLPHIVSDSARQQPKGLSKILRRLLITAQSIIEETNNEERKARTRDHASFGATLVEATLAPALDLKLPFAGATIHADINGMARFHFLGTTHGAAPYPGSLSILRTGIAVAASFYGPVRQKHKDPNLAAVPSFIIPGTKKDPTGDPTATPGFFIPTTCNHPTKSAAACCPCEHYYDVVEYYIVVEGLGDCSDAATVTLVD